MKKRTALNFIISYRKYIAYLVLFISVGYFLLYLTYNNVKDEMIESQNARQMIHAKQAAKAIESFFNNHIAVLRTMAKNEHIVAIDEYGKRMMRDYYSTYPEEISIITRIDSEGRILYPEPYDPKVIHQIVTKIDDFREVKRTHQIVVSDVFTNMRGFKTIIVHVPVFKRGAFDGSLALLFPFDLIARRYVEDIRIGQGGYAWIISKNGIELSCPVPGHVGNSVFDNCRDFPDIIAMAKKMTQGEQGVTTYQFDQIRGDVISKTTKHAVFMPIRLENNLWSIVVATPEDEFLSPLHGFRNRIILIAILLLIGMGFFFYVLFRTQILAEEVERRSKVEEALRRGEATLRGVFLAAPVGICIMKNRLYQSANVYWCESFGYPEESIIGKDTRSLYENDEEYDRVGQELYTHLRERGLASAETRLRRGDGVFRDVILTAAPLRADDLTAGTVVIVHDVTERKQAEEALQKSEQHFRAIFNSTFQFTGLITLDGRLIEANQTALDFAGIKLEDIINRPFWEARWWRGNETRVRQLKDAISRAAQGEFIRYEIELQGTGDTTAIIDFSLKPVLGQAGEVVLLIPEGRDITERKQAEEALRETQRRLTDIIEFLPDATLVIDKDGKVIAWNRAIESMTGVRSEDMLGKGNYEYALPFYGERKPILIDLALHPAPEREKAYTTIQRTDDIIIGEAYTPALAPGNVHLSATASVLRDSGGEIIAAIECIRNNTDRKNMEERLQRAEKMEALGVLAGGVAHDMNNVLGVLVGYSELLLRELPEAGRAGKYAKSILQGSERAAAIIQDLLTLARRGVSVSEMINLNRIVTDFLNTPEFDHIKLHHPDVLFRSQLETELFNIKGSPVHLFKTIMNLLSNAAESINGTGEVTIMTENRYVDVPIPGYENTQEGEYVVLTISDTGSGIPSADLGRIFEPFYTKKVMARSGTGLGLAVVWGTVKDHGGYIDVRSEEKKGSTFTLYFPASREALLKRDKDLSPDSYQGWGESILVVDDVEAQRTLAATILENLNYRVATVASGEDAVEYLRVNKAALIVLDMIMDPGIDGLETYRRMLEIHPQQKAIIVSGFAKTDRVRAAQELGAGEYVKKPYVIEKLGMAVRKELDRK